MNIIINTENKRENKTKEKEDKESQDIEDNETIVTHLNDYFKVPLYYNKEKVQLKKNIIQDLELVQTIDSSTNPIYSYYFNTGQTETNAVSTKITEQISEYYTTDVKYLKETQKLLKNYQLPKTRYTTYKNIIDIWNELKLENGFKEKYSYIDWPTIEFLNTSEPFLQMLSMYNLFSPVLSLLMPIFMLIIPFLILQVRGIPITISEYLEVLKTVAQNNALGKFFTCDFSNLEMQDRIYVIVSAIFYVFSIYQNIMVCIRFHNNMKVIHKHFEEIRNYLEHTILSMKNYLSFSKQYITQKDFNETSEEKLQILISLHAKLSTITDYDIYNIYKFKEIGSVLKYFYELHSDKIYEDAIMYSIGFNGYLDCIEGLCQNIKEKKSIHFAKFSKKNKNKHNKNNIFKNSYYAVLTGNKVKNDIKFDKNIIITGPNASGKTTMLKSTLINIIFTQQFGCGFYDKSNFSPFKHIHCYLNIPDTSGRDSLFQAEARRCKEILDIIEANQKDTHFCVFDELYSGTNPEEAEMSATSFMLYLQKYNTVTSFLTTHFIKICKKLENTKSIQNCKMMTIQKDDKIIYTYKIEKGISEIKGGINILTELNYPKEIINNNSLIN